MSKAVKRPSGDSFDPGAEETRVLPGGRNEPDVDDFNGTIALPDTREAESGLRGDAEQTVATSDAPTYDLYRDDPNSEETRVISPAGDAGDMERTLVRPRGAGDYQQDDADHDRTETLGSYTRTDPETASYAEQRARRRAEAERRASERADRERALGAVPATEEPDPVIEPLPKRTTDKAFASIGLFLFRLVLAVIMGAHAYQHLTNRDATLDLIEAANLPHASSLVWVLGIGEVLIAVALLLGWFTRFTG
ncbi:MAG: DoxX family protein, partial [Cutibacterium sp.]|nr:DoxX family protein [Cutibacterium sp.]